MSDQAYLGISPEDLKGKPYARYWNPSMKGLRSEVRQALLQSPFPACYGFEPDDASQLLKLGQLPLENGYTQLPSGEIFVAVNTPMPGVSGKMIDWWFGWHSNESQRYKLWHPHAHMKAVLENPMEDRTDLSDREKYVGNTSYVDEYIGKGILKLAIQFVPPEEFGLKQEKFNEAGVQTAVCANVGPASIPFNVGKVVHLIRETEDGCEMRSRFWMGKASLRGKPSNHLVNKVIGTKSLSKLVMTRGHGQDMIVHCAMEMTHLASFLPDLYSDYNA